MSEHKAIISWKRTSADFLKVHSAQRDSRWSEALLVLRTDKQFQRVLWAAFAVAPVFFQMASTFGLHVTKLGFSAATYGAIISLNGALVVICELPLTTITRRFPARRVMAAGYLLLGTGFALNAFAHTVPALIGCIVVFTLGEMIAMPVGSAYIADLAPTHMRGRYMGAYALTWAMALVIGPGVGMQLFALDPALLWLTCGALGVLAATIILSTVKTPLGVPRSAETY